MMRISELILQLQQLQVEYGDLPVIVEVNGYDCDYPFECAGVEYSQERTEVHDESWVENGVYSIPAAAKIDSEVTEWSYSHPSSRKKEKLC